MRYQALKRNKFSGTTTRDCIFYLPCLYHRVEEGVECLTQLNLSLPNLVGYWLNRHEEGRHFLLANTQTCCDTFDDALSIRNSYFFTERASNL